MSSATSMIFLISIPHCIVALAGFNTIVFPIINEGSEICLPVRKIPWHYTSDYPKRFKRYDTFACVRINNFTSNKNFSMICVIFYRPCTFLYLLPSFFYRFSHFLLAVFGKIFLIFKFFVKDIKKF